MPSIATPDHCAETARDAAAAVETHTSTLFFTGGRVYKQKKALDLGFVDFRTFEARLQACRDEVALNRRLSPDVYLGVATVTAPDEARPCDALVVMRRMPAERRLSTLVRDHDARARVAVDAVARQVAVFHAGCGTSPELTELGSWSVVGELWTQNLEQLRTVGARLLPAAVLDSVGELGRIYLRGRQPLLAQRQQQGWIRDGHGDLLCDDIYYLDDGPRILDCLEFDRRLRVADVLADIAFLAMDLERLGRPDLGALLVDEYQRFCGEIHPPSLLHFYVAYRALVRAKVNCLRAGQLALHDGSDGDSPAVAAQELTALAVRHLHAGRVRLLIVGGLPGTGKSAVATALTQLDPSWAVLRSDEIRKELAGVDGPAPAAPGQGLYTSERRRRTYAALLERAGRLLGLGQSVVLDASWTEAEPRRAARELAAAADADLVEVRCTAPQPVVLDRLVRRRGDASDADVTVHRALAATAAPWPEAVVLSTDDPLPVVVARLMATLAGSRASSTLS